MSTRPVFIGAVEIGTSKVTVLVGENTGRELAIIGWGECRSEGIVKGSVVDYKAATECTHHALEQAERQAGEKIDHVFLAQSGSHLGGFYNEAAVNVKSADNMIDAGDIRTVCELAKSKELPPGCTVVDRIRRPFRVDGRMVPTSPEHLMAQKLSVGCWTVYGLEQRIADNIHVIRGFNLEVRELVLSSLASGHVVTTDEERQNGVLAIDIGAGTTDYVLYRDGVPYATGVLPVAGEHLTNDLSIALRLQIAQAEKLKVRYGRAVPQPRDKGDKVWLDGNFSIGDRQFPRQAIEMVTAARTREIFEVVRSRLGPAYSPESCTAGVVLTGGTAKLPAIAECAAGVFGAATRLGEARSSLLQNDGLRDPGYHTAAGVLFHGIRMQAEHSGPSRRRPGLLRSVSRLFAVS